MAAAGHAREKAEGHIPTAGGTVASVGASNVPTVVKGKLAWYLYVFGAGDVILVQEDNSTITFPSVPAGFRIEHQFRAIATGTTASRLVWQVV